MSKGICCKCDERKKPLDHEAMAKALEGASELNKGRRPKLHEIHEKHIAELNKLRSE
jgi:hypothetical protein